MENNQTNNSATENIWKFIRGDMLASDFEKWIYANPTLEKLFGKSLHLEIISANFSSKDVVLQLKKTLRTHPKNKKRS